MNLTEKSELNNPQEQLTSGNYSGKSGRTIFSLFPVFGGKNAETLAVLAAKGGHRDQSKVQEVFFCVFF